MSDYLSNLAAKSLDLTGVIQPRLASLFEPPRAAGGPVGRPPQSRPLAANMRVPFDVSHEPPRGLTTPPGLPTAAQSFVPKTPQQPGPDRPTLAPAAAGDATGAAPPRGVAEGQRQPALEPAIPRPDLSPVHTQRAPMSATVVVRPHMMSHIEPIRPVGPAPAVLAEAMRKAAPTIQVTVGRIEVRAITPPAPPAPRTKPARPGPALSLVDYLKQRSEGRR